MNCSKEFNDVHAHIEKCMPLLRKTAFGMLPYSALSVTCGSLYAGVVYGWDNCLMGLRYAASGQSDVLIDTVRNLLHYQRKNGYVPNILTAEGPTTYHWHAQPYLAQSAAVYLNESGDEKTVRSLYPNLCAYIDHYFRMFRMPGGLVRWELPYKSGFDNELVGAVFPPEHLIAPDLNALLYLEMKAMSFLGRRLHIQSDWDSRAEALKNAINQYLWDGKNGCYGTYDVTAGKVRIHFEDENGNELERGRYAYISCPSLLVLYSGAAPEDRAKQMIETYVLSPEHFRSPWGIRSLSRSSAYFNNAIWGGPCRCDPLGRVCNSNWQGPVWVPLCWFALHGLLNYGYQKEARILAYDVIRLLSRSLDKFGGWSENYHSERGDNLEADNFISWNMLADLMPEYCESTEKMRIFF